MPPARLKGRFVESCEIPGLVLDLVDTVDSHTELFGPYDTRTLAVVPRLAIAMWCADDVEGAIGLLEQVLAARAICPPSCLNWVRMGKWPRLRAKPSRVLEHIWGRIILHLYSGVESGAQLRTKWGCRPRKTTIRRRIGMASGCRSRVPNAKWSPGWVSHGSGRRDWRLPASTANHPGLLPHRGCGGPRPSARRIWRRHARQRRHG